MSQGALFSVKVGTVDEVSIANGSQGMKRKDVIVARYTYDQGADTESAEWAVVQGTPDEENPQIPQITEGNIQNADSIADTAVIIVTLDGINITGVEVVPEIAPDFPTIQNQIAELNSNIQSGFFSNKKTGDVITLKHPVNVDSIVFPQPRYNTVATIRCNFSASTIAAGKNTFTLLAHDTETGNASTSTTLAGYYLVVPMG